LVVLQGAKMKYLLAIIMPPLAVLCYGRPMQFFLNIILTLCLWVPGVIHAFHVVSEYQLIKQEEMIQKNILTSRIIRKAIK
jgi:uncharacterized membrane protein YqaE (UPF0057 family)